MSHARWLLILMLLAGLGVAAIDAQAPARRGRRILLDEAHHNLVATGILTDYTVPGTDNRQFTLHIVRWLSREL